MSFSVCSSYSTWCLPQATAKSSNGLPTDQYNEKYNEKYNEIKKSDSRYDSLEKYERILLDNVHNVTYAMFTFTAVVGCSLITGFCYRLTISDRATF